MWNVNLNNCFKLNGIHTPMFGMVLFFSKYIIRKLSCYLGTNCSVSFNVSFNFFLCKNKSFCSTQLCFHCWYGRYLTQLVKSSSVPLRIIIFLKILAFFFFYVATIFLFIKVLHVKKNYLQK